ncbi:hypothetical protein LINPERHAP1_LOCUS33852 [Linum perenne]
MDYKFCCCVVDFYRDKQCNHPVGYRIPSLVLIRDRVSSKIQCSG